MMSRAWAVGILAAAGVVGLDFGCRPKPELHGKPCTQEGHECGPQWRPGQPGEACVIVYSDEHFECTGDGYCAQRCDDQWETCMALMPSDERRERCLEYARQHTVCPPGLVCKTVPTECDPSGLPHTHELSTDRACVPENVYPMKAPARRSSCSFSPP